MAEAEEDFVSIRGVTNKFIAGTGKLTAGRTKQTKPKTTVGSTSTGIKSMSKINKSETQIQPILSAREREAIAAACTAAKRAKDDERANKDWLFPENYHIYRDVSTNQEYRVTLTRLDIRKNKFERYQIRLYETNDQPYRYATYVRYSGKGLAPVAEVKASLGSDFQRAYTAFKDAFREQTLICWDERDKAGQQVGKAAKVEAMNDVAESIELGEGEKMVAVPVAEQPFVYRRHSDV
jgi:hypothetical protein